LNEAHGANVLVDSDAERDLIRELADAHSDDDSLAASAPPKDPHPAVWPHIMKVSPW
jgi:hypothetical protein